jgi:hypothetical protein
VNPLCMVPEPQNMLQSNILNEYPLLTIYSVATVVHAAQFCWRSMVGMFNVFGARQRLDFSNKEVSQIDSDNHVGSSSDLYGSSFPCLPKNTVEKCQHVHARMLNMPNCMSTGQLKTNLDRIDMEPGMWWMFTLHMRSTSFLNTPRHPVYYAEVKAHVVRHNMDSTKSNTLLIETLEINDHHVRIRCYLAEHVRMLQTIFFTCLGLTLANEHQKAAAMVLGLLCVSLTVHILI